MHEFSGHNIRGNQTCCQGKTAQTAAAPRQQATQQPQHTYTQKNIRENKTCSTEKTSQTQPRAQPQDSHHTYQIIRNSFFIFLLMEPPTNTPNEQTW